MLTAPGLDLSCKESCSLVRYMTELLFEFWESRVQGTLPWTESAKISAFSESLVRRVLPEMKGGIWNFCFEKLFLTFQVLLEWGAASGMKLLKQIEWQFCFISDRYSSLLVRSGYIIWLLFILKKLVNNWGLWNPVIVKKFIFDNTSPQPLYWDPRTSLQIFCMVTMGKRMRVEQGT